MSNNCVFYLEMTNIPSLVQGAENGDLTQIPVEFTIDLNKDIKGGSIRKYKTVNDNQFYKVSLENLVIPNLPIDFNINNYDVNKPYVNGLNLQSFDVHKNGIEVQHSGGGSIELFKQHDDAAENDVNFKTFNKVDFWVTVDSSKELAIAPVIEDALYTLKNEFPAPTVGEKAVIQLKHNLISVTGSSSTKFDSKFKAHIIGGNGDATVLLQDAGGSSGGIDIVLTKIGTGHTILPTIYVMNTETGDEVSNFFDASALKMEFDLHQIITSGTSGYGYTAEDDLSATTAIILQNKGVDTAISVVPLWSVDSVKLLSQPAHDISSLKTPTLNPNTENDDLGDDTGLITLSNPAMRFINNIGHPFILPHLYVSLTNSRTNVVNFLSNNPSSCEKHFRVLIDDESYTRPHLFFRSCASCIDYYTDLTHPIKFSLFLPNGEPLKYKPVSDDKKTDWNRKQLSALFKFETHEKSSGQICMRHTGSDQM